MKIYKKFIINNKIYHLKMIIKDLLQDKELKNKYILKLLIQHFFSFTKEELYKNWNKKIDENTLIQIKQSYKKYEKDKIPIEYILWYTFFMWKKIYVNENTLIPRPETEYLVNYAYNFLSKNKNNTIFDIWTWSWIIWNILNILTWKKIICSDISHKALQIAKKNNKNNTYLQSNLWEHLKNYKWNLTVCSNLPYVADSFQIDKYVKKEPSTALFAWKEWLDLYIRLIEQIFKLENKIECFFELTTKQWEILIKEFNLNWKLLDTCHENIKILNFNKKRAI